MQRGAPQPTCDVHVNQTLRILLIEDNDGDARLVREHLRDVQGPHFEVTRVATLAHALDRLYAEHFDAALLDLTLPDSRGLRTLRRVLEPSSGVPVVVLTGLDDDRMGVEALKHGAQDYVVKDEVTPRRLARTLRFAIERNAAADQAGRWQEQYALWIRESSEALWDWDLRTNQLTQSPGWATILGNPEEPVVGSPDGWFNRVHPSDAEALANVIDEHIRGEKPAFSYSIGFVEPTARTHGSSQGASPRSAIRCGRSASQARTSRCLTGTRMRAPSAPQTTRPATRLAANAAPRSSRLAQRQAHRAGELAPGTRVGEHYRVESLVDVGSSGAVYRCRDDRDGGLVAIKVLHSWLIEDRDSLERFVDEGKTQLRLRHANIVAVYDLVVSDHAAMIVMEFVQGATLRDFIASKDEPATPSAWIALLGPLIDAIGYAHTHGIVHRDIKPENVLVVRDQDGFALKLTDFGLAKLARRRRQTRAGEMLGTLHYMAPEQFINARDADHRADIYALGCTVYELLTRRAPFDYESDFRMMTAHLSEQAESARTFNPLITPQLSMAIERAMSKEPDRRYATCAAFADALRDALSA